MWKVLGDFEDETEAPGLTVPPMSMRQRESEEYSKNSEQGVVRGESIQLSFRVIPGPLINAAGFSLSVASGAQVI